MTKRGHLTRKRKAELFLAADGRCGICREKIVGKVEWDHHLALVFGGTNANDNWRPLHPECHRRKSAIEHRANCKAKRLHRSFVLGEKRKTRKIKSRGFSKEWRRRFDGRVERREQEAQP